MFAMLALLVLMEIIVMGQLMANQEAGFSSPWRIVNMIRTSMLLTKGKMEA